MIFFFFTRLSIVIPNIYIYRRVKHIPLPQNAFAILFTTILKGVEKATPWTHAQFNNSLKENQGQSIVHEIVKKNKLFRTCYYIIPLRSCKYSHPKSFSCHLWFKRYIRYILFWPFKRILVHFCLLCMNCQALSQIKTSIPC